MKTAIVTGTSRGLGLALAQGLLKLDYQVISVGRSSHDELDEENSYRFIACDLSNIDDIAGLELQLGKYVHAEQEQLVLINNAATAAPVGVMGDLSDEEIISSLQLNLASVVQLANSFCRIFSSLSCDKRIVNISSGAAFTAIPGSSVYCIAKAGIEMLTQTIATENAHHGVSAMSIQPGFIDTGMQTWLRRQDAEALPSVEMYRGFQEQEQLLPADTVAQNIIKSAVLSIPRNGESFSHDHIF